MSKKPFIWGFTLWSFCFASLQAQTEPTSEDDLFELSLEQLMEINVASAATLTKVRPRLAGQGKQSESVRKIIESSRQAAVGHARPG
jgi:hypothetical protein